MSKQRVDTFLSGTVIIPSQKHRDFFELFEEIVLIPLSEEGYDIDIKEGASDVVCECRLSDEVTFHLRQAKEGKITPTVVEGPNAQWSGSFFFDPNQLSASEDMMVQWKDRLLDNLP
jgi:hypothetical protein